MGEKTELGVDSSIMVSVLRDGHFQKHCTIEVGVAYVLLYIATLLHHTKFYSEPSLHVTVWSAAIRVWTIRSCGPSGEAISFHGSKHPSPKEVSYGL